MRSAVLVFYGQAQTKAHECHCPKIQRKYSGNAHVIRALFFACTGTETECSNARPTFSCRPTKDTVRQQFSKR
jgi:hypothetical protein